MSAAPRQVVVTGIGLLSPLGDSAQEVHDALCAGRLGLRDADAAGLGPAGLPIGHLADPDWRRYLGDGNLRPLDRSSQLAASAAALALADAGWAAGDPGRDGIGLVLGTMFGSVHTITQFDRRAVVDGPAYAKPMDFANTVINAAAGQTAIWHGLRGVNATVSAGSLSGLQALAFGADLVRAGRCDALLAGGVEELCAETLLAFRRAGLLCGAEPDADARPRPLESGRTGFALAEGAAFLVLEEEAAAARRGAVALAEIRGHGAGLDPADGRDEESAIEAVAAAVGEALRSAAIGGSDLDALALSANGAIRGDAAEARGLERALDGKLAQLPATTSKAALGEAPGAAGALQCALLLTALRCRRLPGVAGLQALDPTLPPLDVRGESRTIAGRLALVSGHGLDGQSAALVLEVGS
ncbi:MAG: beta-ketoacyl synthase N-terminal-like domain-containing protein [Thermoanaerobaculia bacterium]